MIHYMIDGYRGNENRLDDIRTVNAVLTEIVSTLGLDSVMPPFLLPYYYAKDSDDDGISAFVILCGGHITLHTFPRRGCVFADLLYDGYADEGKFSDILRTYFKYGEEKRLYTERRFLDTTIDDDRIWRGGKTADFGPHIIARIPNVDVKLEEIYDMLDEMPQKINMFPISRPYVIKSRRGDPEYISGIVLIAQSHIAFHYCIAEKTLFCDAFSCSFYKAEQFIDYLEARFGKFDNMTLIRGSKHERKINSRATKILRESGWIKNSTSED